MSQYKERTITCKGCGQEVTDNFRPNQKYCSLECYRSSKHPEKKNGKVVKCDWCGENVYKPKVHLDKSEHHFCSLDCQIKWQGRNKVTKECEFCGDEFTVSPILKEQRFCSVECRDKSPNWNGNKKGGLAVASKNVSPTKLEIEGRKILEEMGYIKEKDFKERMTLKDKFNVDVFFEKCNLIIEWDGEYWHGHPSQEPLNEHQKYIRQRDKSQNAYFTECGYTTLRFWEREVYNSPEVIKEKIRGVLNDN